jgi:GTP-binding protein
MHMLSYLSSVILTSTTGVQRFTLQSIITKADCIPSDKVEDVIGKMRKQIWKAAPLCLPPIVTSAGLSPPFGIDEVRKSVAEACGLWSQGKRG